MFYSENFKAMGVYAPGCIINNQMDLNFKEDDFVINTWFYLDKEYNYGSCNDKRRS